MRKRWIGIVGSLLLAAVGTFVLVQYVGSADTRALAGQEAAEVLVVTEPVAMGSTVEEMAASVEIQLIPANVHAPDSVSTLADLTGQVTAVDLVAGEQVLSSRFITPAELEAATELSVPSGLVEVTVSLTPERAVGGNLVVGDLVTVFASFEPFDLETSTAIDAAGTTEDDAETPAAAAATTPKTPNSTGLIITNTLVTNIQTLQSAAAPAVTLTEPEEGQVAPAPENDILVTIAVTPAQAERLVFTAEYGALWLGHESADVTADGSGVQTRVSIYETPGLETTP